MKDLAKFIAIIYFVTVVTLNYVYDMGIWLTVTIAFLVIMQTQGWLHIAKFMAVLCGVVCLFWITQTTSFAGCFDVIYAGFLLGTFIKRVY